MIVLKKSVFKLLLLALCSSLLLCAPGLANAAIPEAAKAAARVRDFKTLAQLLIPLAEQGDQEAQYQLAGLYRSGRGVDRDLTKAADWMLRAAEQGHPKAKQSMGMMYQNGLGVEYNDSEAQKWLTAAGPLSSQADVQPVTLSAAEVEAAAKMNPDESLRWLASKGDLRRVRQQLAAGAKVDARDQHQRTALI